MAPKLTIAKPLAPEDLKPDCHVAALFLITEHLTLSEYFGEDEPWKRRGVVRTQWLPCAEAGMPLRIVEVCLPFVLIERPDGKYGTIDVRRTRLALLSPAYARKAFKKLREAGPAEGTRMARM